MTTDTPRQQRLALIETQRLEAARLLTSVNHDAIKDDVRNALRDLDEAVAHLNQENVDNKPHVLRDADVCIDLATQKLAGVTKNLVDYGSDAKENG
jgi:hypothetical protein